LGSRDHLNPKFMGYTAHYEKPKPQWTATLQAATVLDALFQRCEGAYSAITLRSSRRDLEIFSSWCEAGSLEWLPGAPRTVAEFIDEKAPTMAVSTTI